MSTVIHLVRHGAHDRLDRILCGRMTGVSLNALGQAQAQAAARVLAREPASALYVSPMQRAFETAAPIAEALGLEPRVDEAINEVDFGPWTGMAFSDLNRHPEWPAWSRRRREGVLEDGESRSVVHARVGAWMASAQAAWPDGVVAAVCHGDVIKAAVAQALDLSLVGERRLQVDPGSITTVEHRGRGWRLRRLNLTPDL